MAKNLFAPLDRAAAQAMKRQDKMVGAPSDPDLARYEQLGPNDFATIAKVYGPDNLIRYIKTMEARRMKGGAYGK